jgi:hypothetical protein
MPDFQSHIERRISNIKVHTDLCNLSARSKEWEVTVLYYAVLHAVDAVLAAQTPPVHPPFHDARKQELSRHPQLRLKINQYCSLETMSRKARYDCNLLITDVDVTNARSWCEEIITQAQSILSDPGTKGRPISFKLPS